MSEVWYWLHRLWTIVEIRRLLLVVLQRASLDTRDRTVKLAIVRLEEKFHYKLSQYINPGAPLNYLKLTVQSKSVQPIQIINIANGANVLPFRLIVAKHEPLDTLQKRHDLFEAYIGWRSPVS